MEIDDGLVGEWVFDPAHTRIGFSARHAMITKVRGAFNEVEGRFVVAPSGAPGSSVTVRLAAASVDTRNPQRDGHLRSPDFFDVEHHPDIVFTSTTVDEVEDRMFMVIGDLTIRGITHEVAIPIELRGIERGADGELRAGFEGSRRVDRRQWGLEWQVALDAGSVLVSERVTMEFEVSAVKRSSPADDGEQLTVDDVKPGAGVATPPTADDVRPEGGIASAPAAGVVPHDVRVATTQAPSPLPTAPTSSPPPTTPAPSPPPTAAARRARHRAPSGWLARMRRRD